MAETTSARLALHQLEADAAGVLAWKAGGLDRVGTALRADLTGATGARAVDELLRLMSVLRNGRQSPAAADALGALLRGMPAACALARAKVVTTSGIDRARGFAEREGRPVPVRAPDASSAVPAGALPARALLDLAGADRARARSTSPAAPARAASPHPRPRKDPRP